jgi:hypothetical protein
VLPCVIGCVCLQLENAELGHHGETYRLKSQPGNSYCVRQDYTTLPVAVIFMCSRPFGVCRDPNKEDSNQQRLLDLPVVEVS